MFLMYLCYFQHFQCLFKIIQNPEFCFQRVQLLTRTFQNHWLILLIESMLLLSFKKKLKYKQIRKKIWIRGPKVQGKKWGIKMRTPHHTQTTTVPTLFIVALPPHSNNTLPSSRLFQNSPPTIHKLKIKSHHERSTFSSSLMTSHHANQPLRFPFFFIIITNSLLPQTDNLTLYKLVSPPHPVLFLSFQQLLWFIPTFGRSIL